MPCRGCSFFTPIRSRIFFTPLYDISIDNIINSSKGKIRKPVYNKWISGINESYPIHANVIRDMLGIKEEQYTRILSYDECKFIIESLCTF